MGRPVIDPGDGGGGGGGVSVPQSGAVLRIPLELVGGTDIVLDVYQEQGRIVIRSTASAGSNPLTTKGDLMAHDGAVSTRVPVGADGEVLTADSGDADGISWQAPAAGELTLAEVEKDLGSIPMCCGSFDITGLSGLAAGKQVLITQKAGPYTGKGDMADEAEMDAVAVTGYVVDANTIRGFWSSRGPVVGNFKFGYAVSA